MVNLMIECSCKVSVRASVNQRLDDSGLLWSLAYQCSTCGEAVEVDGIEDTPHYIREALLKCEGVHGLVINEVPMDKMKFIYTLKKALSINSKEALRLTQRVPGLIVKGTYTEIERIRISLKEADFQAENSMINEDNDL